jgi:hypothetical protein
MRAQESRPRALFLSPDGTTYSEERVCSGAVPGQQKTKPCPLSDSGRIRFGWATPNGPSPMTRTVPETSLTIPLCVVEQLGTLGDWMGKGKIRYPPELWPLRLMKCAQMFLLVVPGIS